MLELLVLQSISESTCVCIRTTQELLRLGNIFHMVKFWHFTLSEVLKTAHFLELKCFSINTSLLVLSPVLKYTDNSILFCWNDIKFRLENNVKTVVNPHVHLHTMYFCASSVTLYTLLEKRYSTVLLLVSGSLLWTYTF